MVGYRVPMPNSHGDNRMSRSHGVCTDLQFGRALCCLVHVVLCCAVVLWAPPTFAEEPGSDKTLSPHTDTGFFSLVSKASDGRRLEIGGEVRYVSVKRVIANKDIEKATVSVTKKSGVHTVDVILTSGARRRLAVAVRKKATAKDVVLVIDGKIRWIQPLKKVLAKEKVTVMSTNDGPAAQKVADWFCQLAEEDTGLFGVLSPELSGGRWVRNGSLTYVTRGPVIEQPDIESVKVYFSAESGEHVVRLAIKTDVGDQLLAAQRFMPAIVFVIDGRIQWERTMKAVVGSDKLLVMKTKDKALADRVVKQLQEGPDN